LEQVDVWLASSIMYNLQLMMLQLEVLMGKSAIRHSQSWVKIGMAG
jgi:hypothetical protein